VNGACGTFKGEENAYRFLMGKPKRESPLKWGNNVKIDWVRAWTGLSWLRTGTSFRLL
jgi:hypothetical protein